MPSKTPNLFELSGKEPPKEKLPTVKQYIKENPNNAYPVHSPLITIWFPGKWENYSLETRVFRASIGSSHPLYSPIDKGIVKLLEDSHTALLIELVDSDGTIGIRESNLYGQYSRIGNVGYRFDETKHAN